MDQAGRVNLFYGASTGALNATGQYTAGLIANATNPIALNNPTAALVAHGRRALGCLLRWCQWRLSSRVLDLLLSTRPALQRRASS